MASEIPANEKTPYVFLGRSGLKVSNMCLGAMTFGESQRDLPGQNNEDESHEIIKRFAEWGGNFIDTANVYGMGNSETILGKFLEKNPRDNYVIATKCRSNMGDKENVNNVGLSRRHITDSIDKSLARLHTDYVDLYQTHVFDTAVDIEETLRTLNDLVRIGKVRYLGVSNVTGWQLQKLVCTAEKLGVAPIISLQQQYSLLSRESEWEPFQVCKAAGIGVLPWSPLKMGLLTGKYRRGVDPTEGRIGWMINNAEFKRMLPGFISLDDWAFSIVETAEAIAKNKGRTTSQVSLRWLLQKDVVSSVIFGARTLEQLDDNMGVNGWSLTKEEMDQLDKASAVNVTYPYDLVTNFNLDRLNSWVGDLRVKSVF